MKLKLFIFFFFSFYFISSAADYFWVGGSGNWSDINHWRTTSGGNSLPSVIPGPNDDVFFDVNSGFTTFSKKITIDADVNCRNIKFNGSSIAPILTDDGNSFILNIYGSSEWQLGMPDISVSHIYYRNTNSPKTIKSNGVVTGEYYNEIYFEEKSSITLSDSFYNKYNLHITAGTFNTNNHNLKIGNVLYLNDWGDNRTVNLGTSTLTLTDGGAYVFANSNLLTLNASQSNIVFLENGTIQGYLNQVYNNITFNESGTFKGDNTTVKALIFNGDSQVFGNNNFDDLRFLKEGDVYLENGKTQNIKVLLEVNPGDCSGFITLKSDYDGYLTTVNALTGYNPTILVKDVIMQDITATGIANFTANNSTNVSNNSSNWTFVSGAPKNFYWIGGSGNWNNNQHWSLTSGGVFTNCLPTPNDNVFFDQNSGFSVNNNSVRVNVNAFMHNITVSGSSIPPSIKETTSNLNFNIYGSSEWQTGMNPIEVSNIYYKHTGQTKTIKSNGVETGLNSNVYIEEQSVINLLDDFIVNAYLYQNAGTLNSNNHNISVYDVYYLNIGSNNRVLNLGSSTLTMLNPGAYIYANTSMLTINSGTSNIIFKEVGFMSTHFNQAYHNILFEKIGTYNGGLTTVNKLEFLQNANIKGSNNFNSLIFNNTSVVELEYNTTQNIKVLFKSNPGNCIGWMTLKSSLPGNLTTIQVPSGFTPTFDVSNVIMQDIRAVGSFTFNAYNSVDNSNNPGWIFLTSNTQDMFWVGGTGNWNDKMHWSYTNGGVGGACIPGPGNNVFFNSNSGFNVSNNLVSITGSVYMKNITISGTTTLPVLSENEDDSEFNIYGSSEWQTGMTPIDISNIYYRNIGINKTIKSNGVITGKFNGNIYLEESTLITLLDKFISANQLYLQKGEFVTNNQILEIGGAFYLNFGDAVRTLTLGSSLVNFTSPGAIFFASTDKLTLNSGTSKITFYDQAQLKPYNGQTYYDVIFEKLGTIAGTTGSVNFRNVEFHSDGNLEGNNIFYELIFNAGFTYVFEENKQQQTTVWTPGGTPCNVTTVKSSSPSVRAQILINGGSLIFNFVNIQGIEAINNSLHFQEQSTNNGNNLNITFDPYNPGEFPGFNENEWINHIFDENVPSTYILSTSRFFGTSRTLYKWYKLNSETPETVISNTRDLDLRNFGYGFYEVEVIYNNTTGPQNCIIKRRIKVTPKPRPVLVNPHLIQRAF